MPEVKSTPEGLRTYVFHGMDLTPSVSQQWKGECPFCNEEKFHVHEESAKFDCKSCDVKGNQLTFIRLLHEKSMENTAKVEYEKLAKQRKLTIEGLHDWGVCRSVISNSWVIPSYNPKGNLNQLYRYTSTGSRMALFPAPGIKGVEEYKQAHGMFGINLFSQDKSTVCIAEAPWDGIALYDALRQTKFVDDEYKSTTNEKLSLLADINVIATPSANIFLEYWEQWTQDKEIIFLYDNDWYLTKCKKCAKSFHIDEDKKGKPCPICKTPSKELTRQPVGFEGIKKAVGIINSGKKKPKSTRFLQWGENGFTPELKSGYDLRDMLGGLTGGILSGKMKALFTLFHDVPDDWLKGERKKKATETNELQPVACESWKELVQLWVRATRWRQELEDVLATMLAVAISTLQLGDQLFLQVIGDAGTGKSTFCDAMLTSKTCHALEQTTGFHSGYTGSKEDGDTSFSLITRIQGKTLITSEADTMVSSPRFPELMAQLRRIFDGKSSATYKTKRVDENIAGLRTPWIMAGTRLLLSYDQSKLGDRFLKIFVKSPGQHEKREILRKVSYSAFRSVLQSVNGDGKTMDENKTRAYQLTGGYVNFLRTNTDKKLNAVQFNDEELSELCMDLAEFTADMRARPEMDIRKDVEASKELPSRLTHQFGRLAICLAAVTQRNIVDKEIQRIVRKVAIDTSHGRSLNIVSFLRKKGIVGCGFKDIQLGMGEDKNKLTVFLAFLVKIEVIEKFRPDKEQGKPVEGIRFRLTYRIRELYDKIFIQK